MISSRKTVSELEPVYIAYANGCDAGYINGGKQKYADESGFNLDTQVLVFKVRLPQGANPLL
jgi:hypothetical protein